MKAIPSLEFDDRRAVIGPKERLPKVDIMPKKVVLTFFQDVVDRLYNDGKIQKIYTLRSEMGRHIVYKFNNDDVALFALGVGGPLAAGLFEELIALGGEQFMCCGGVGMLINKELGCLIVPNEAVRDEGLSYHYVEPSRTIKINKHTLEKTKSPSTGHDGATRPET